MTGSASDFFFLQFNHIRFLTFISANILFLILISYAVSPNGIVSTEPMILIASKGDNITLTCQTEAGPNNTYIWIYKASNLVCTQSNCSDGIFTLNTTDEGIQYKLIIIHNQF